MENCQKGYTNFTQISAITKDTDTKFGMEVS